MEKCNYNGYKMIIGGHEVDPCDYELVEEVHNCTVQILKCRKCGETSIGWYREGSFDSTED